ncbi:uncharacterized protein PHALS_15258 [Plasmopara halstedii]|uniref:Uncharacterized protein n=1 Tax=Plasmopara halstedii TaxID=4781 RepID=A0A0P1ATA3_PLAHL|nr:uncharacterized protein PHALS_15258 [Plasmopara halstedii]CEG44485.1 hypothetical protein PHALS_15258 [Plasmopara halstedii]|eukprot:XP_024580854.1 hypothetical protein PHALS_15258 [Plasmopara halstedii]
MLFPANAQKKKSIMKGETRWRVGAIVTSHLITDTKAIGAFAEGEVSNYCERYDATVRKLKYITTTQDLEILFSEREWKVF